MNGTISSTQRRSPMAAVYNALDRERREIRLLRFDGPLDQASRTIHCSLDIIALADPRPPVYVALSYLWGPHTISNEPLFKVYIDGNLFPVTDNLIIALVYLNLCCAQQIPLWIDAICINQADPVERGHQVALMRDIYTTAFHVWTWLIPIEECDLGMDFINEASSHVIEQSERRSTRWPALSKPWLKAQMTDPARHATWNSLVTLFKQPYWRRNWIIQELYLNKNVTIVCGKKVARLGLLFAIISTLADITIEEGLYVGLEPVEGLTAESWHISQIALLTSQGSENLGGLIERFISCRASDPRDNIYSLVGIAKNYTSDKLAIDYTIEWPQVFRRATKYIIEDDGNLDILASAASGSPELPSWVANFAKQSPLDLQSEHNDATPGMVAAKSIEQFKAGGRLCLARFNMNLTRLTVKAVFLHNIEYILPRQHGGTDLPPVEELTRRLRFMIADYALATNQRNDKPRSFGLEIAAFASIRLYQATFYSVYFQSMVEKVWPVSKFVQFAMKCIPGNGLTSDCTAAQLDMLRTGLANYRSLFRCELPAPAFSLEADFRASRDNVSNIEDGVLASLRHCKFQVPAYCRNQHGWGQNGDILSIVYGCNMPLLLRPVSPAGQLPRLMRVVSEAYVYGVMKGEALGKGLPEYEITLV